MASKLKPVFISAYVTLLAVGSIQALYNIVFKSPIGGWVGVLLALGPMLYFFIKLFMTDTARTDPELRNYRLLTWLGGLITVYFGWSTPDYAIQILYSGFVGIFGIALYLNWYSKFENRETTALSVGNPLPDFILQDENGNSISSDAFIGSPTLIIFYRGNWCPLCMAQIKEVSAQYQQLADLGVAVALVSPQPHENTRNLAKKFSVPFKFLVDTENAAAKKLGIFAEDGTPKGLELLGYDSDTVMPTVIITDAQGNIIFADLTDNYRVRPEPDTFIQILKEHTVAP